MVRTAIACGWCRRSKIKCVHQGEPPCRNCLKNGRSNQGECVLSRPVVHPIRKPRHAIVEQPERQHSSTGPEATNKRTEIDAEAVIRESNNLSVLSSEAKYIDSIKGVPRTEVIHAASIFHQKYPELRFLHLDTFDADSEETINMLFKGVMMALYSPRHGQFATYVKSVLCGALLDPPRLLTVQTLLLLAMYEWGNGKGYGAWMTTGTAIRIIQSLETMGELNRMGDLEREVYNRTFWSCFIMDRAILCGKGQPLTLPLQEMRIHLPVGDQDFAFGQTSIPHVYVTDTRENLHNNVDHSYSILVRGFDIWSRILKWVINGGRRLPGMTALANCPWTMGSPWDDFYRELKEWRETQHMRMKYPGVSVAGHASIRQGEQFVFVNLIYYISVLFLCREYIPFLPTPESEPQGPVDPPLLEGTAPPGWWPERADQLFNSATQITTILKNLDDLDIPMFTPFAGFCMFSAASMNAYISFFPRMNHGKCIPFAQQSLNINIQWLSRFKNIWRMGNGWFKTILNARELYERASKDRQNFQGKTRADFEALEASIHDTSGVSPISETGAPIMETDSHEAHDITSPSAEPAQIFQNHPHSWDASQSCLPPLEDIYFPHEISTINHWDQMWPLWGEQQSGPLNSGDLHIDYDITTSRI